LKQNRIVKAFMKVMDLCYEKDPQKRGTAIQVARILHKALAIEELERRKIKNREEESYDEEEDEDESEAVAVATTTPTIKKKKKPPKTKKI
jgi:hypothetical protein